MTPEQKETLKKLICVSDNCQAHKALVERLETFIDNLVGAERESAYRKGFFTFKTVYNSADSN